MENEFWSFRGQTLSTLTAGIVKDAGLTIEEFIKLILGIF